MVDIRIPFSGTSNDVSRQDLIDWYTIEVFPALPDHSKGSAYRRRILREYIWPDDP